MRSVAAVLLTLLLVSAHSTSLAQDASASPFAGTWEGAIQLPGMELQIRVQLRQQGSEWAGTIDIPIQGAFDLPLKSVAVEGSSITFIIGGIPTLPTFSGRLAEGKITGPFTQGPIKGTFYLGRDRILKPRVRPQEPQPPLPYRQVDVKYTNSEIALAGTLTVPEGAGPFPTVLLISGSGQQDRDESLFGHRPFFVLADRLTRAGIAVLRVDDRGTGESGPAGVSDTTETFVGDVLAGVEFLKTRAEVDAKKIGLIGHSEGGLIAPMAASKSKDVAFIVMLAGPGVNGRDILVLQNELISRAAGMPEDKLGRVIEAQKIVLDAVIAGRPDSELDAAISELLRLQSDGVPGMPPPSDESLVEMSRGARRQLTSAWMRFFLQFDPATALKQVKVPVLVLNGSKDLQVDAGQNLPAIERALKEGGNPDVTVHKLDGLNHLFQKARTGSVQEYGQLDETFNEEAMKLIADWINARFGTAR